MRDDLVRHEVEIFLHFRIGELATDQALHRVERVLGIGHRLALGRGADEYLIVLERDDRRRGAIAFRILDNTRGRAFHDRDAGIGRAEVDTDDLAHLTVSEKFNAASAAAHAHKIRTALHQFKRASQR